MTEKDMTQEERLDFLVRAFLEDSDRYRDVPVPDGTEDKRRLLRSLMNVRMPGPLPEEVLRVQREYLRGRAEEKGIVGIEDIPEVRPGISIWQGDITRLRCDAIVNAANSQMLGCFIPMHSCIDNCIHTYAGTELRMECFERMNALRALHGSGYEQPTAVPFMTGGYALPAKHVIHVVGPIVAGRLTREHEEALAACYTGTLDICAENSLSSVAFCCISTGVFSFPGQRAAQIAVEAVDGWRRTHPGAPERVVFNVFTDEDRSYYERELC